VRCKKKEKNRNRWIALNVDANIFNKKKERKKKKRKKKE
jgi:hypothetical protein